MDLLLRLSKKLKPYQNDRFLLAISGGMDSVALFYSFLHLRKHFGFQFSVAHIHHGPALQDYRDRALDFVQNLCRRENVEFFTNSPTSETLVSESDLRQFRYQQLEKIMLDTQSQWLVLAHHKQDLLETRLMRLIRGTGTEGLESMAEVRGNRLRPLLDSSADELREYLLISDVQWIEDPSNQDRHPLRNWMRHEWLPQLENKIPGALNSLSRSLDLILEEKSNHSQNFSCIQGDELILCEFIAMNETDKKQALAVYMKALGLRNYGRSHVLEALKRLDTDKKDLTFQLLRRQWVVNAGRVRVLGLGEIEPGRA